MDHSHHHHSENHSGHKEVQIAPVVEKDAPAHEHHHHEKERHDAPNAHDKHAGHHTQDFLKRFWICLILTVPLLLLSHMIQQWLNFTVIFPGDKYLLAILSAFIFIYGGHPFLKGLINEVKDSTIGMMTLIGVAISVAWIYSMAVTF